MSYEFIEYSDWFLVEIEHSDVCYRSEQPRKRQSNLDGGLLDGRAHVSINVSYRIIMGEVSRRTTCQF